ncbi:glycosyltransferase family 9 protein [Candidatus Desantisbacteria bacterium]|nr:glycosyltransferase family 9 protein [Candidatus Desantisbacteria bacterium]
MDKVELFKLIDKLFGTPLCFLLGIIDKPFKRKLPQPADIKKILVIKLVAIGDLVVALPTLRALKQGFPHAHLALMTTPRVREVVEGCPYIDEIIYYDILGKDKGITGLIKLIRILKEKTFDLALELDHYYRITSLITYSAGIKNRAGFDLPGQGRRGLVTIKSPYLTDRHEIEAFLEMAKAVGAKNTLAELVPIWTSQEDEKYIDSFFKQNKIQSDDFVVAIHPGTGPSATCRRWAARRFADLADWLIREYKAKVIFTGAPSEVDLVNNILAFMQEKPIVAAGKTSLKQLAQIARRCGLFISVDTGPLHVAAAMGTRVIGLYGPNIPSKWGPYGEGHLTVYKQLPCSPCTRQYLGQVSRCQNPVCMEQITVEDVKALVSTLQPKCL